MYADPEYLQFLLAEVEQGSQTLKGGKPWAVDNVPEEFIKCGGEEIVKALTTLCWKIWETKQWRQK